MTRPIKKFVKKIFKLCPNTRCIKHQIPKLVINNTLWIKSYKQLTNKKRQELGFNLQCLTGLKGRQHNTTR